MYLFVSVTSLPHCSLFIYLTYLPSLSALYLFDSSVTSLAHLYLTALYLFESTLLPHYLTTQYWFIWLISFTSLHCIYIFWLSPLPDWSVFIYLSHFDLIYMLLPHCTVFTYLCYFTGTLHCILLQLFLCYLIDTQWLHWTLLIWLISVSSLNCIHIFVVCYLIDIVTSLRCIFLVLSLTHNYLTAL